MSSLSEFESRTGKLDFSGEKVYKFVTDLRNFKRFMPGNSINILEIGQDSGSFHAGMLGNVDIRIKEKVPFSQIVFTGSALGENNYSLILKINDTGNNRSEVRVSLIAELTPFLKMVAADPVRNFLETLINEMEKFRDWDKTI